MILELINAGDRLNLKIRKQVDKLALRWLAQKNNRRATEMRSNERSEWTYIWISLRSVPVTRPEQEFQPVGLRRHLCGRAHSPQLS